MVYQAEFKQFSPAFSLSKKALLMGVALSFMSSIACATVVEIRTSLGNFEVNLFDNATPKTVENFLSYVTSGAYVNNVVHRVEPNFVVQAGGFQFNGDFPPDAIATGNPVVNEPKLSNRRGTIAMAKLGGNVNSATSQWFINLSNNSSNLDSQNGGFSVFGQVLGDGMDVVDAIAELRRFNAGGAFASIPLRDFSTQDAATDVEVTDQNLVIISDIVVTDSATLTHPEIVPVNNTASNNSGGGSTDSGGSGGAIGWLSLMAMLLVGRKIRRV